MTISLFWQVCVTIGLILKRSLSGIRKWGVVVMRRGVRLTLLRLAVRALREGQVQLLADQQHSVGTPLVVALCPLNKEQNNARC
jgi:hypothetical protein